MAEIKTGNKITATDLNNLKTAIKTMYDNRSLTSTQIGYAGDALNTSKTFSQYSSENLEQIQDLINACLVINDIPNLLFRNSSERSGQKIFEAGTTTDLLAWVNTRKNAKNNSGTHGCRAACLGTCSGGCSTTNARGASGSGSVSPGASGYCSECTGGCQGCSSGCSSTCESACTTSCRASCAINCSRSCSENNCSGGCLGACSSCSKFCTGEAEIYPV